MSKSPLVTLALLALLPGLVDAAQRGGPVTLPDGEGKVLVEAVCTTCHGANQITRSVGWDTAREWRDVFATMVDLPEPQAVQVASYLATHFPDKADRRPVLTQGDTEIEITEWLAPTLGQRVRDPAEAPDGAIWWTGMWASIAGRLDPVTGDMEEFQLPETARPHTIVPDEDGYIWYTGNSNATIGRLDPRTGDITEYQTEARDPHSAVFHPNGMLYFTAQRARMLGRLNPETGELTEVATEPNPYGIKVDSEGTVWVAYNGVRESDGSTSRATA
jgi:virginiamycin B lyase